MYRYRQSEEEGEEMRRGFKTKVPNNVNVLKRDLLEFLRSQCVWIKGEKVDKKTRSLGVICTQTHANALWKTSFKS